MVDLFMFKGFSPNMPTLMSVEFGVFSSSHGAIGVLGLRLGLDLFKIRFNFLIIVHFIIFIFIVVSI